MDGLKLVRKLNLGSFFAVSDPWWIACGFV